MGGNGRACTKKATFRWSTQHARARAHLHTHAEHTGVPFTPPLYMFVLACVHACMVEVYLRCYFVVQHVAVISWSNMWKRQAVIRPRLSLTIKIDQFILLFNRPWALVKNIRLIKVVQFVHAQSKTEIRPWP